MRAPLGVKDILFPDLNMFVRVGNWDKLAAASHGVVGLKVWQAGISNGSIRQEILANFRENLRQAERRNMIVIGYAFGVGGVSGRLQADELMKLFHMGSPNHAIPGHILALDLEHNPSGPTMTTREAIAFVSRVRERTGRYPFLYSLGAQPRPGILGKCPRWIADWGSRPEAAVWQFTDGGHGPAPRAFPGVGHCDINRLLIAYGTLRRLVGL